MKSLRSLAGAVALVIAFASPVLAQQSKKGKSGRIVSESGLEYLFVGKGGAQKKPVFFFLHGTGGHPEVYAGTGWAGEGQKRGYIMIFPHSSGSGDAKAGNSGGDGTPRWADVDVPKLVALAREIQRTQNGDPKRTYIGGHSNGGFYACETALAHPEVFSAFLCIGGGANRGAGDDNAAQGAYFVHGTNDRSVKFDVGRSSAERLRGKLKEVVFREYPNRGHDVFDEEAKALFDWLPKFSRRLVPGSVEAGTDLDAALARGKVLVYLYSARDADHPMAEYYEWELLPELRDAAVVKLDREQATEFKVTKPTLLILDGSKKVLHRFDTRVNAKAIADKLK
jgi:predicted esterase